MSREALSRKLAAAITKYGTQRFVSVFADWEIDALERIVEDASDRLEKEDKELPPADPKLDFLSEPWWSQSRTESNSQSYSSSHE